MKNRARRADTVFLPDRNPLPPGSFIPPTYNSFYPPPPPIIGFGASLDTSGGGGINVDAGPTVDGEPLDGYYRLPLNAYLFEQKSNVQQNIWDDMARRYLLGERPDEVTRLLRRYTNIKLPVNVPAFTTLFGKPEINIGVSGSADVHVAVRSDFTNLTGVSALGSTQTAPVFSQDLTVNVNGKIGDKLLVTADWNTQRTFDYENQLKVKYTGYDDEIIRSIEAGNVTLQTPSRLISGSEALFGVKAVTQFGPFFLTTLAAQKKGATMHFSGGAGGKSGAGGGLSGWISLRPYNYSQDHYFLDKIYRGFYEQTFSGTTEVPPSTEKQYLISQIEVWVSTTNLQDQTARQAVAVNNLYPISQNSFYNTQNIADSNSPPVAGQVELGRFVKLTLNTQYKYDANTGVISINPSAVNGLEGGSVAIAVAYKMQNGMMYGNGTLSGQNTSDPSATIILKLIRPKNLVPSYPGWQLLMKNYIPIGGSAINTTGMDVTITYQNPPDSVDFSRFSGPAGNNEKWVTVFGLDKTSAGGGGTPDGRFDALPGVDVDTATGEIIFPFLEPFSTTNLRNHFPGQAAYADSIGFDEAYDTTAGAAANDSRHNHFFINIHTQGGTGNVIYLNAFNIAPGSVRVFLNGQLLTPNVDYTEDDFAGTITLRNPEAIQQRQNVSVELEQNDIFSTSTRTLLGWRGDLAISKNIKMGFTLFDYNEQLFTDKIRLGEEPISNWIGGIDGSANLDLPFLSKALSALPIFDSKQKTSLSLSGEIADVMPSHNNNNSSVTSDGTQGTAMIDDFEGARYSIPLGGSYGFWHFASPPAVNNNNGAVLWDTAGVNALADSDKIPYKARLYWYNIVPSDVLTTDIWPRRSVATPTETWTVLNFSYDPAQRGIYNVAPSLVDVSDPRNVWAGAMRSIYGSPAPTDLTSQNVTDLEIWMQIDGPIPPTAKLFFDLGLISEAVIPNDRLMTEDGITAAHPTPTGILYPDEDVGIDQIDDAAEKVLYAANVARYGPKYPDMYNDPNGDDWYYQTGSSDYTHINGLEGNGGSEFGRTPDTEDLNGNNSLDAQNSYFEYDINLDTTSANPQRVGEGTKGWTEIRIPLQKFERVVGSPSLQNVQSARIWMEGFTQPVTIRFAQVDLVGSRWVRLPKDSTGAVDTNFSVSFVNYEDNSGPPDFYTSPPGVNRPRNPLIQDHIVYENEQSLELNACDLAKGNSDQAVQYETNMDLFNYKTLGVFAHGDNTMPGPGDTTAADDKAEFFIRFGTDSLNYYEYREPLHQGWDDIRINFSDITAVKSLRDSATIASGKVFSIPAANQPYGAAYSVRGQPTATSVQFFSLGVLNPSGKGPPGTLCTSVWMDELRVIGSNSNSDWAAAISAGLQLGSLGQVQFSATQNNPDFHSMDTRFGDRILHRTWTFSAQTGLEKFLKFYPGLSVPFVYSHTETIARPRYLSQSDVDVETAVTQTRDLLVSQGMNPAQAAAQADNIRTVSQTVGVADAYAINGVKIPIPIKYWLFDDTWNKVSYGFSYNRSVSRSPYIEHLETWQWNAVISYGVQFKQFLHVSPFGWSGAVPFIGDYKAYTIYAMPSQFHAAMNFSRSQTIEKDRANPEYNPTIRSFTAVRSAGLTWPLTENGILNPTIEYNLGINSTLLPMELTDSNIERPFGEILRAMFFPGNGRLLDFGPINGLTQTVQITMKPKVPKLFSLDRFTDMQSSYNVAYSWANTLSQGDFGKGAGWNSNLKIGANVRLKKLTDEWFGAGGQQKSNGNKITPAKLFDYGIKTPFLDFDAVNITFTQTNSSKNQGLQGGTGLDNFWRPSQTLSGGPNRLYQLGLISYPDGNISLQSKTGFPFFQFVTEPGRRAINGIFNDNFQQSNALELRTNRNLWNGATLQLNWKSQWNFNNNQTIATDSLGIPSVQSGIATLDISRSYLSIPPFLFFSVFNNTISNVVSLYQHDRGIIESNPTLDSATKNQRLTEALADDFESGFEALSIFPKAIQRILPRLNWTFRWEGLEKLPFLESFAQRVSIEHTYTGLYTRRFQSNPDGSMSTQGQTISIGFQPLLGVNMTLKDKVVGGNLSGAARYNTTTSWTSQGASSGTIQKDLTTQISLTATYRRQGLKFPFFGLDLKNDVEASFTFSSQANSSVTFDVNNFKPSGTPLNGSTTFTMEPRITYTISNRVNASLFYRIQRTIPDASGSTVPETSTVEAGLDIHISISGGQ